MRIGIDIDDTICNTFDLVLPYICEHFNLDYEEYKKKRISYRDFTFEGFQEYALKNYKYIIPNSPLKKGVIKYIKKLRRRGHQIIFITGRDTTEFEDPYTITYNYLIKNNVPFDKLLVNRLDKGNACIEENIDIYFDDEPRNYKSVEARGIDVYLFNRYSNELLDGFKRVNSIKEIYKIIKKKEKNKV